MKLLSQRMHLAVIFALTLLVGVGAQTQPRLAPGKNPGQARTRYADRQVIVKLDDHLNADAIAAVRSSLNARLLKKLSSIGAELWQLSGEPVESAIERYRQDPRIMYVEPNYLVDLDDQRIARFPNDPRFSDLWGLHNTGQTGGTNDADIDAPEAWDIETGNEVIIGVIDTGVDWTHEDLAANIWVNAGEIPNNGRDDDNNGYIDDVRGWDFVNNDNNPMDDEGHGSHVSGTIAAAGNNGLGIIGVSWSARIMPLKFLDASGGGTTADAILALEYAMRMGAHLTNNSWGGDSYSQALSDAIAASGDAGMLFIAAAGNDGSDNDIFPHYPSNYDLDNIIAVAATDDRDQLGQCSSSNWGATSVDLGGPGDNILSTTPGNSYSVYCGTSMATPHVSGAVSLIWSRVPGLSARQVKEIVLNTVDPVPALQGQVVSGGRLNVFNALIIAEPDSIAPAVVTDLATADPKSNFITLTWTASGDDGSSGTAAAYDIRYSISPINSGNFAEATGISVAPAPKPAGEPESLVVGGLDFNTTYYFALKVLDEQGNVSEVSNSPFATTLGIPVIALAPDSLADSLLTGAQSVQMLTVANNGEGNLDFNITIEGVSVPAASVKTNFHQINELRRKLSDSAQFAQQRALYKAYESDPGHNGTYSTAQPIADFNTLEIYRRFRATAADSLVVFHDDMENGVNGWSHYSTYANGIDQWAQTSNRASSGATSWQVSQHDFEGSDALQSPPIDLTGYQDATLTFMHWYNFDDCSGNPTFESDGGLVEVSSDGGSNWTQIFPAGGYPYVLDDICNNPLAFLQAYSHDGGDGNDFIPAIFDLTPFAGNTILLRWHAGWDCGNCEFNEGWYIDDVTVHSTSFAGWLAANPDAGSVFANNSLPITVSFDATGLNGGDYAANVVFSSNDPQRATVKIPVRLHVIGAPDIALSDSLFDFGTCLIGDTAAAILTVANFGTDELTVSSIASDDGDYSVPPDAFTLAPDGSREVLIRFIPSAAGGISGTLTLATNDPDEPVVVVVLHGTGVLPPEIAVSPDSLRENLLTGQIAKQILTIANTGLSDLSFELAFENIDETIPPAAAVVKTTPAGKDADGRIENSAQQTMASTKSARNRDAVWTLEILRANERVAAAVNVPLVETNSSPAATAKPPSSADEIWRQRGQNASPDAASIYAVVLDGIGTLDPGSRLWDELNANWMRFGEQAILIDYSTFHAVEITYAGLAASGADAVIISNNWDPTQPYGPFSEAEAKAIARYVDEGAGLYISGGTFNNGEYPQLQHQVTYLAPLVGLSATETYDWNGNLYGPLNFSVPDHPVLRNIPAPFISGWQNSTLAPLSGTWTAATIPSGIVVGISTNQQTVLTVKGNRVYHSGLPDNVLGTESDKQFLYNAITLAGGATWLSATPLAGTVSSNSQMEIEITVDATGLKGGIYTADLVVTNNDPDEKRTIVPVHVQVTDAADISVDTDTLEFGQIFTGTNASLKITVENRGSLDLLVFSAVAEPAVYAVTPAFAGIDPGGEEVFTVRFSPQAVTEYAGTLTFTNNDPDEQAYVVTLLGQGVTPPDIEISPPAFAFDLHAGDSTSAMMTIANTGGSALDFAIRDQESLPGSSPLGGRKLYWTETFDSVPDTIHRSNLDGTAIERLFTGPTDPLGIAVDEQGGRIYWAEYVTGRIRSSLLDGSDAKTLLSNLPAPVDVAIDAIDGKIYWTDFTAGTINRANLDGSEATIIVQGLGNNSRNAPGPRDGKPLAYTPIIRSNENALQLFSPWGIALDLVHSKVYWTEQGSSRIGRANLDGSGVETVIDTGLFAPRGIKLDVAGGKIYFVDSFSNAIKRANLDGGSVETVLELDGGANALDIELDINAKHFYWSDNLLHRIQRADFDGSNVISIIADSAAIFFEGFFGLGLLLGTDWLTEIPTNGRIEADSAMSVELRVDTKGLVGGDYQATILVATNDPDELEVPVSVTLHVTGVPAIAVSRDTLSYGAIFVGASVIDTLIVSNVGTAVLAVTDISSNMPEFATAPISFELEPGQRQTIVVTFEPSAEQEFSGQLTITSDDPNKPGFPVALLGRGVLPPVIAIEPDSLRADLFSGQIETQLLNISNRGRSDLRFEISLDETGVQGLRILPQVPRDSGGRMIGAKHRTMVEDSRTTGQASSSVQDDRPIAPTNWNAGQGDSSVLVIQNTLAWGLDMASFLFDNLGVAAVGIPSSLISTTDFSPFDLIITVGDQDFGYYDAISANVAKFEAFVAQGGVVQYQLATQGSNVRIVGGVNVQFGNGENLNKVLLPSHPIVAGLPAELPGNSANHCYLTNLPPEAAIITATSFSEVPTTAEYEFGDGTVVATGMTWEHLYFNGIVTGRMLPNAVAYSLSLTSRAHWLSLNPSSGIVPADSTLDIEVAFNAADLPGGDYRTNIVISSNDPVNSQTTIPVRLQVTGAPAIAASDSTLDFGAVFIGATAIDTLMVSSIGTDSLIVSAISLDNAAYSVDTTRLSLPFGLASGQQQEILVQFVPRGLGDADGTLTIRSNARNAPDLAVALTGSGIVAPDIAVVPDSLAASLFTGTDTTQIVTIFNSGGSDLIWQAIPAFANSSSVVSASPVFGSREVTNSAKTLTTTPPGRPSQQDLFTFVAGQNGIAQHNKSSKLSQASTRLEEILNNLNQDFAHVTGSIPNRFDFSEGESGNLIFDGDLDMYDGGNFLSTDLGGGLFYSDNAIVSSAIFGNGGRYFTRKYPGLFVLVADMAAVADFVVSGNLGADGSGNADGAILETVLSGTTFQGFVKRVYNAGDPSVNHLIIIEKNPAASHEFSTNTDDDFHRVYNLFRTTRLYYLLYAGTFGYYIDNQATLNIMNAFLQALDLAPQWITATPDSGRLAAGSSIEVAVEFDAAGLQGGDYQADLLISSNDPDERIVAVAAQLRVTGAPVIAVPDTVLSFGEVLIGTTATDTLLVSNVGTDTLKISSVTVNNAEFSVRPTDFILAPGENRTVEATFTPAVAGSSSGTLIIVSNDNVTPQLQVALAGVGVLPPPPGTLFASTGQFNELIIVDPETGTGTLVGSTLGHGPVTEIEFREDGVLFGTTGSGFSAVVTLDLLTGEPKFVTNHAFGTINGLEFSADTTLYGTYAPFADSPSELVKVDLASGNLITIGSTGFNNVGGLAFSRDSLLYGVTSSLSGGDLITINITTGAGTLVGPTGFPEVSSLEFGPDGVLYGGLGRQGSPTTDASLIKIDPATGHGTLIGSSGFSVLSGLAFFPGGDVTLTMPDTLMVVAGDTVDVPVVLDLARPGLNISALGAAIHTTNALLSFVGFTIGPIVPGQLFDVNSPTPDSVRLAFADFGGGPISTAGVLVTLRFRAIESAELGGESLLQFSQLSAADPDAARLSIFGENGRVTVVKFVSISGNAQYCDPASGGVPARPAPDLNMLLVQEGAPWRSTQTDSAGNYTLANVIAGQSYRLEARRESGGQAQAITTTDALIAFNAFLGSVTLSGCQNLAADVDANHLIQPVDALLVFNFFLGKITDFPAAAWRAYPASFDIDATPEAWHLAPTGIDYPLLNSNTADQNFLAVVRGDVDLSWPNSAAAQSLTKRESMNGSAAQKPLQLSIASSKLLPGEETTRWTVNLEGEALRSGIHAFGAELQYPAAQMEILQLRWSGEAPKEGYELGYNLLPAETREVITAGASGSRKGGSGGNSAEPLMNNSQELVGRLRFGGFSTSTTAIHTAGALLEIQARLKVKLDAGTSLPLRLSQVSAAVAAAGTSHDGPSLAKGESAFIGIEIAVNEGTVSLAELPADFGLSANYPNPFNPKTQIRYQLPEPAQVKLEIFNAIGQIVRTLVDEAQDAAYYNIEWNARNEAGEKVASGLYFYRLKATAASRTFSQTRKMMLLQ